MRQIEDANSSQNVVKTGLFYYRSFIDSSKGQGMFLFYVKVLNILIISKIITHGIKYILYFGRDNSSISGTFYQI